MLGEYTIRAAVTGDCAFLVEMARQACMLEGRPPPPPDDPTVLALLPNSEDATIVAESIDRRSLGAVWWTLHKSPLVRSHDGGPLPEMAMAVIEEERGKGIGAALIECLAARAAERFDALTLNVHLLNPAVRLYTRTGFEVAGAGRGPFGVAMIRTLDGPQPSTTHSPRETG